MTCAQKQQTEAQLETHQGVNTKVYDPWMDLFLSDEDRTHCLKNKTFGVMMLSGKSKIDGW